MRMISHDRYRRCFARVPPRTHACTHLRTRTSSIFICAGTFDAWHHLARRTDRAAALRLQLTVQYSTRRVSRSAIKQKINEIQSWKIHIFSRMYDSRNTWKKISFISAHLHMHKYASWKRRISKWRKNQTVYFINNYERKIILLLTRFRISNMAINIVRTVNYSYKYIKNSKN